VGDTAHLNVVWQKGRPSSPTIIDSGKSIPEKELMTRKLPPLHPGEILREEFLIPLRMSAGALAKVCGVPRTRIERLANEETGITADTALRLSKAFGTSAALWLNLQNNYDIELAKRDIGKALDKIAPVIERAA
jgi:addiction module HigA family antidote